MPTNNVVRYRGLALCCIPKAANTSIKWVVLEAQGIPPSERWHRHRALNLGYAISQETQGFYTAAFLRHPGARLYSAWADKIRQRRPGSRALELMGFRIGMRFPEFVRQVCGGNYDDFHIRPQADFLAPQMDFLGLVERMPEDWPRLQARFPWLPDIGRHNTTRRWIDSALWVDMEDMILERYAVDYELWHTARNFHCPKSRTEGATIQ